VAPFGPLNDTTAPVAIVLPDAPATMLVVLTVICVPLLIVVT
jgi:hypothetical protein